MPISVNTNITALLAQQYLTANQNGLTQAVQRLSSGLRINDAADDPAGLAISTSMTNTIDSLQQAARNGNDGISLIQSAETAINDISGLISQMTQLATQASNGTYTSTQLNDLQTEFSSLLNEVQRVANVTEFNGVNLLNGSTSSVTIQIGSGNTSNDRLTITLTNLTTGTAGLNISSLDVSSSSDAQTALSTLNAISTVSTALAQLGANETKVTAAVNNDYALASSLESARSRVQDADFAAESTKIASYTILSSSSAAMLAQANAMSDIVWQLLKH